MHEIRDLFSYQADLFLFKVNCQPFTYGKMRYTLQLQKVAATIGYLACHPEDGITDAGAISYLTEHPFDEYMHTYLLGRLVAMPLEKVVAWARNSPPGPVSETLLAEAALQRDELKRYIQKPSLPSVSPLVDLSQQRFADMELHRQWSRLFSANIVHHKPFPPPDQCPALPYSAQEIAAADRTFVSIKRIAEEVVQKASSNNNRLGSVTACARKALEVAGIPLDRQLRHQMSLAPVGLVRDWKFALSVKNGRLDYSISGTQTSFGRGMDFEVAQVGLFMEICERVSSWAAIGDEGALGYRQPVPLIQARYSELGTEALDPDTLPLEVPDGNLPLHWVSGSRPDGSMILVPAQFVFLFTNLDEPLLCSSLGSTGLGAGLDMTRARVTALLEVIERDAESVMPYNPARCFRITAADDACAALLKNYAKRGIELFFEDITSELGVPCYRAFVVGPEGQVMKGAAAALSGSDACISAMLEVPYPYPWGPPSLPAPQDLPIFAVEDLPDFSTGSLEGDLALLERLLAASNRNPVYVDLTREDMTIPVCRAIIPGMELMADFDRNSRLSPRLFANLDKDRQRDTAP